MELPPQMGENGAHCPELYPDCGTGKSTQVVAKLNHYLYGQKDAARAWMASVMAFFDSIGAVPLVSDRMAFRWEHDGEEMNVAVHVDDFVATPSSTHCLCGSNSVPATPKIFIFLFFLIVVLFTNRHKHMQS